MKKTRKFQEDRLDKQTGSVSTLVEALSFSEFRRRRGDGVFPILDFSAGRAYQHGTYNSAAGPKVIQFQARGNSTQLRRRGLPRPQPPANGGVVRKIHVIREV